jgi:transcriptional regulator with XRE-family HTH domain
VIDEKQFFQALGQRIKQLRKSRGRTQEDMIGFGFSARHWQQIEAGRPITIRTLLRICDTFGVRAAHLVEGLDRGIYKKAN